MPQGVNLLGIWADSSVKRSLGGSSEKGVRDYAMQHLGLLMVTGTFLGKEKPGCATEMQVNGTHWSVWK